MIRSMTGYGGAKGTSGKIELSIELRSVNNRFLDCNIRLPRAYTAVEGTLKAEIQKRISRGKVDVFITIDSSDADDTEIRVNDQLVGAYYSALAEIARSCDVPVGATAVDIARLPDALSIVKKETDTDVLYADICSVLNLALDGFSEMREQEGQKLKADIEARLRAIDELVSAAEVLSPKTVSEYIEKLTARMNDVLQNNDIEQSRILTEAALFADKVAINEEIVRLRSHMGQLLDLMDADEPVGRKLDFIVQEMNREANTIGSKGNNVEMARIVVDIKAEIEKIREQAQNIE